MSNLTSHAETELRRAGLFSKDSDYEGMLGKAVLELMKVFAKQGHSGFSAHLTLDLFKRLGSYQTLTPITNDPTEWMNVSDVSGNQPTFQSNRNPSVFSSDGGKTYYLLDEVEKRQEQLSYKIKKFFFRLVGVETRAHKDVTKKADDVKNS